MTHPLVGREAELQALEPLLRLPARAGLRLIQLVGDPGVGKTRLLSELHGRAQRQGRTVLAGQAAEFDDELPYAMVREAICPHLVADPRRLDAVPAPLPAVFGAVVSSPGSEPGAGAPGWTRYVVWDGVRRLLEEIGGSGGLVLSFDDVHWADPASIELVGYLLRQRFSVPITLVLCYRPRQVPPRLAAAVSCLSEDIDHALLAVGPLSETAIGELLGPVGAARRRELYMASGGNPLYALALAGQGPLAGQGAAPDPGHGGRSGPAEFVLGRVSTELSRLDPASRTVARAAAVLGEELSLDLLAEVAELRPGQVDGAVDDLAAHDLLRADDAGRIAFRHPLVRQAAYQDAGPAWRLGAHRRAAQALTRTGAALPLRAHHLQRSAKPGDKHAQQVLERAATEVLWHAPDTAATWFATAARLAPDAAGGTVDRLILAEATALGLAGNLTASRAALHSVLARLPRSDRLREQAICLSATMSHLLGQPEEAAALVQRELGDGVPPVEGQPTRGRLWMLLAVARLMQGRWAEALRCAEAADTARAASPSLRAQTAGITALAEYTAGTLDAARAAADEAAVLVDGLTDEELAGELGAVVWLGWAEMFLNRYADALRHQQRGLVLARHRGQSHLLTHLLVGQASAHKWLGQLPEALRCSEEAREVALLTGSPHLLTMALAMLCWTHTWLGDDAASLRFGQQAMENSRLRTDWFASLAPALLAQARLEAGDAQGCADTLLAAAGGPDLPGLDPVSRPDWYHVLARASVEVNDLVTAKEWAERAHLAADGVADGLLAPRAFALLAEAEALLATGSARAAAERAEQAAADLDGIGNVLDAARARLLAGQAYAALGTRRAALELLQSAEATFARCSAATLRRRTARELRRLGHRIPIRRDGPEQARSAAALSAREAQVGQLIAQGQTNRGIARALFLSEKTVERHVGNIFVKLRVASRSAVATRITTDQLCQATT